MWGRFLRLEAVCFFVEAGPARAVAYEDPGDENIREGLRLAWECSDGGGGLAVLARLS